MNVLKGGGLLVTGQPWVCVALVGPGSHYWFHMASESWAFSRTTERTGLRRRVDREDILR